jgi:hypothetical protein
MSTNDTFLDAFTRVQESLQRTIGSLTLEELVAEPHPSMGWLAWRLTRVIDSNVARLSGQSHLWMDDGWHERFGMPAVEGDFGRGASHTREQVRAFSASAELLLAYHQATYQRVRAYLASVPQTELERVLDEPQYNPLPTVSVRLVSVLENAMNNAGQISYLKAYHQLGGWFPREASDPSRYR